MEKILKILILIILSFLFFGCIQNGEFLNNNFLDSDYALTNSQKISINTYFNSTILDYNEVNISEFTECISGICEKSDFLEEYFIRDCYFCDINILNIENNKLELESDRFSSGSSDFFAGCKKDYSGKEINGLDIIEINPQKIVVRGEISTYFSQKSFICDRNIDVECDDIIYGSCSGPDFEQKYIRTVELIFENKNN